MSSNNSVAETVVITDAGCLIILQKIELLRVLNQLFSKVITTPEIVAEYGSTLPEWISIVAVNNKSLQSQFELQVDKGEASAIALAHEIDHKFLITDDLEARQLAARLGLSIIGTLGIILRAKHEGFIEAVRPVIGLMKQTNFRVSEDLYQMIILKANET